MNSKPVNRKILASSSGEELPEEQEERYFPIDVPK